MWPCRSFILILRQAVDGAPKDKLIGDSFPMDQNSKTRIAGQLKLGPTQTTYFSFSESGDLPNYTYSGKLLGDQNESDVKGCSTHRPLWYNSSWLKVVCELTGGSWDTPNMDCDSGKPKGLAKGNPEECPIKVIQTVKRVQLSNSLSLWDSSIYTYYTSFFY